MTSVGATDRDNSSPDPEGGNDKAESSERRNTHESGELRWGAEDDSRITPNERHSRD